MIKKRTLSEVGTYAELKDDPNSSPLQSFTICSTIMATILQNPYPVFFNILDDQQSQIMAPWVFPSIEGRLGIYFLSWSTGSIYDRIPPVFPNQWIRSCVAFDSSSGLINWVVEGRPILLSEKLKGSLNFPKTLGGKLIMGAMSYGGK